MPAAPVIVGRKVKGAFKGKTALVTGGGRGIGRAIALGFAAEGASVVVVSRTHSEIARVAGEIAAAGGRGHAVAADVTKEADVRAAIADAERAFGGVDILVNNAGTLEMDRFEESDPADWWRKFEVHLRGAYLFTRYAVPGMLARRCGRIINMASAAGKQGFANVSAYTAAKHALVGLTRSLALEFADRGVTVNAVCPGYTDTALGDGIFRQRAAIAGITPEAARQAAVDRVPQKVLLRPEDIVPAVLFLASDAATRTTGEAMNISGGMVMH